MSEEKQTKTEKAQSKGKKPEWRYDPEIEKDVNCSKVIEVWHLEVSEGEKEKKEKKVPWEFDPSFVLQAMNNEISPSACNRDNSQAPIYTVDKKTKDVIGIKASDIKTATKRKT